MPPRQGPPPQRRPPMPPEGPTVIRRDGRPPQQNPANQAWSQVPPEAPQQPRREDWAPTQRPQPFQDDPRRQGPPRQDPQRQAKYAPAPPRRTPPNAPPRPPEPPKQRRPRKRRSWGKRIGITLLVLLLALAGAVYYVDSSLNRIDALPDYAGRVADTPGTNWLIVGSDSREGLTPEQEQALATGGDTGPKRTDTVILVHVPKSGKTTMVSIPRDSYVPIPGYGSDKINAAFAFGGAPLLVQTVEEATGLRIDHYAEIGFSGFAGIVDAVGGVNVCLTQAIDDPLAGINLPAGCQDLKGSDALGFVRTRATALADLDRMNNQRQFMSALLSKATSPSTFLNPFRLWPLVSDTAKSLQVDEGDHIWNLASLAWALRGGMTTTTVPVAGFEDVDGSGNVLLWDKARASQFFDALANDQQIPQDLITTG
ncbi:LCP family protein required for cell wall assembly [Rhodococcus erythropolis]|nr:LCP family protein required for cell wall assembly [Rhodococcus erythropolis]MCW2298570.1 LCP family protein required for cell wall assembly [Rhodococcus erythropolis]MCW2427901.1 LCP family protein required for cell wall assembly [Rhodococcus erythropolis]